MKINDYVMHYIPINRSVEDYKRMCQDVQMRG